MGDELDELTKLPDDESTGETAKAAEAEPAPEGEKGAESSGETPSPSEPAETSVPVAALLDERGKRQEAERRLAELEAQNRPDPPKRPDANTDPDGAVAFVEQTTDAKITAAMINMSRMVVASTHQDFAEREAEFMTMAESNPALVTEMLANENPALYAYRTAVAARDLEALKDVGAVKDKIRAEVEAEVRAKIAAESTAEGERLAAQAAATGIPSLATATEASSGHATPTDEDLESVIGADFSHRPK